MNKSTDFQLLHIDVQRWVWAQNWRTLQDIQERAIGPILKADCDVIISAATAAGKTEAAFLPACSRVADNVSDGVGILYISPLKALINDQFRRLRSLGDTLGLPITPWHGDVSLSVKKEQIKKPRGVILITPESLESLLLNKASWCVRALSSLHYIIIDEFHAFLGTERGRQLQSLMHRIEFMINRCIPRIALSATLKDMEQVAKVLRPHSDKMTCRLIESNKLGSDLKIQLRGYLEKSGEDAKSKPALDYITDDVYGILRGKSNLIFANSRKRTEAVAAALSERCRNDNVPNEFFPHHGSLSKEIRENLEARFQKETVPTSAVCTMTLELGIDIGKVDSIAQITSPHSVASLRQRLGRSGRRGNASVLRFFIPEDEIAENSHPIVRLRLETVQSIAMVSLLIKKWYEPPSKDQYHFSTLVQQTLSVIGQYGGVRADQLWNLLCKTGPFSLVGQKLYADLLTALGKHGLITQMHDGQIIMGLKGEEVTGKYDFYTAFYTPEEYRLECESQVIGALPVDRPLFTGQFIIFAGKYWKVLSVNPEKRVIVLRKSSGGKVPTFLGEGQPLHDVVRQEMHKIYMEKYIPSPNYLDKTARALFLDGLEYFHAMDMNNTYCLQLGNTVHVFLWRGDLIIATVTELLRREGLSASHFGGVIDISDCTLKDFYRVTEALLIKRLPAPEDLAGRVLDTIVEKHDHLVPQKLRNLAYGKRFFDVEGAINRLKECVPKK